MRVKRRAKLRRLGYEPAHEYQLLKGFTFLHEGYGRTDGGRFDDAAARSDWADHRDELMAYWLQDPATWTPDLSESHWFQAEPGGPGSRPWGWWTFDAPEPRRITAQWGLVGARDAARVVEQPITVDTSAWPGLWRTERWRHFYLGMRNPMPGFVDFESEWTYLARLDLLTLDERAAIETEDGQAPAPPDLDDPQ